MVTLSKTDYLIFRECHKNAWLKIHRPAIFHQVGLSEFDKAIIETATKLKRMPANYFRLVF
jgi:hypothetical protein